LREKPSCTKLIIGRRGVMADESSKEILEIIDERFARLRRDVKAVLAGRITIPEAECGCFRDKGCCGDKSCCGDKGCCKDKSSRPPDWEELVSLSERANLPVEEFVDRIRQLDSKLLKGK